MCGIAGIIPPHPAVDLIRPILAMAHSLRHRGPDNASLSCFTQRTVKTVQLSDTSSCMENSPYTAALAHTRLSIIDLDRRSNQPFFSDDGRYALVYNGEVYNYVEVRAELEKKGHLFKTASDTEVVLRSYAEWGVECLNRFNGMFAFAVWDNEKHTLFCARDRFGIKPFFFALVNGVFFFASEIKALFATEKIPRIALKDRCLDYLFTGKVMYGCDTFWANISCLEPGTYGWHEKGEFTTTQWYHLASPDEMYPPDIETIRDLFDSSVSLRLRSDIPIGLCLSGGIDSGYIATSIAHNAMVSYPIRSFTGTLNRDVIGGVNVGADWDNARNTASIAKTVHTEIALADTFSTKSVAEFVLKNDQPVKAIGAFNQYALFSRMHDLGIKVVMDGQGGDELFLGYYQYYGWILRYLAGVGRIPALLDIVAGLATHGNFGFRNFLLHLFPEVSALPRFMFNQRALQSILLSHHTASHFRRFKQSLTSGSFATKRLREISNTQLPWLLQDEDHNSMAHSIESRVPFLDYRLVEYACGIQPEWLLHKGWSKWPLRKASEIYLPKSIAWNRHKSGFYFDICRDIPGIANTIVEWMHTADSASYFLKIGGVTIPVVNALPSHLKWRLFCMAVHLSDTKDIL